MLLPIRNIVRISPLVVRQIKSKFSSQNTEDLWNWIPPRDKSERLKDTFVIPIIKDVMLTPEEVKKSLISQGAEDVIILPLKESIDTIESFVIGTGKSHRQLRKLSESIVMALKDRGIHHALGSKGVEGDNEDDWQCVDCHKFLVHLMLPETRKHLDLETHWSMDVRPTVPFSHDPVEYERNFAEMLELYPCPNDYIKEPAKTKVENEVIGKL